VAARSKGRVKPRDYLAAAASSRGLYRELVQDALGLLPPADGTRTDLEPLESFLTLPALAERLRVSRSTVQGDIARLENFGWVSRERPRRLGHREGTTLHLLSDVVAREETGERTLVSRYILSDIIVTPGPSAASEPDAPTTGLARKWKPPK
jgi:DNA-binding transcriptional MocR family regulator